MTSPLNQFDCRGNSTQNLTDMRNWFFLQITSIIQLIVERYLLMLILPVIWFLRWKIWNFLITLNNLTNWHVIAVSHIVKNKKKRRIFSVSLKVEWGWLGFLINWETRRFASTLEKQSVSVLHTVGGFKNFCPEIVSMFFQSCLFNLGFRQI